MPKKLDQRLINRILELSETLPVCDVARLTRVSHTTVGNCKRLSKKNQGILGNGKDNQAQKDDGRMSLNGNAQHFESVLPRECFVKGTYRSYRTLAEEYQERLMGIMRVVRTKWHPLDINIESIFYQGSDLVVKPVFSKGEIKFRDYSFRDKLRTHLDFVLGEFEVDSKFHVEYTPSGQGVIPFAHIKPKDIGGAAFLTVYFRILRQDLVPDRSIF